VCCFRNGDEGWFGAHLRAGARYGRDLEYINTRVYHAGEMARPTSSMKLGVSAMTPRSIATATSPAVPPHSIARYTVTNVPIAEPGTRAGDLRQQLSGRRYDDAAYVFLIGGAATLVGIAGMGAVLSAPADTPLAELAKGATCPVVTPDTDREEAASAAIRAGTSVLGVCGADGRFIGAVPASALISILRDEHLEDLHHMAGILSQSEAAKEALTAAPHRGAFYRLPWLLVGMVGSAVATMTMARFEHVLAAHIAVAFFIPAIVYLADAVGTQSEAVAVRGLSLTDTGFASILSGELATGLLLGSALGALAFPAVWLAFGSIALASTVAVSLAIASGIASTLGFLLPWLFARFGYDPALGSGPVGTVVQDVLSLLVYFLIASALIV
jgi:magnesium transporter